MRLDVEHHTLVVALVFAISLSFATAALILFLTDSDTPNAIENITTAHSAATQTGTLTGQVTAGPTCPVERAGHPCPPEPVSATVQANSHGRVIASTHTDKDGRYRLHLAVGTYTLVAVTTKPFPRCSPTNATVIANHTTRARISCDTGIR